jgi:Protein of unknown function DUF2617
MQPIRPSEPEPLLISPGSLHYRIITGNVPLEPLKILEQSDFSWHDWHVRFNVLGASHAVTFTSCTRKVTELLTCGRAPAGINLILESLADTDTTLSASVRGLSFETEILSRSSEDLDMLTMELPGDNRLVHEFPNPGLLPSAWTKIGWEIEDEAVNIMTLHTYPEERVCIVSKTRVQGALTRPESRRYGR